MIFGLTEFEYQTLHSLLIGPLLKQNAKVWIFGSRARGDHKRFSDIDVLFELASGAPLPPGWLATVLESLEESSLPYKVDVVNWSELAESYRESVLRDRVPAR
jgi:predicted nucleotidyltransferase